MSAGMPTKTDSLAMLDALLKLTKANQTTTAEDFALRNARLSSHNQSGATQVDRLNLLHSPNFSVIASPFSQTASAAAAYLASSGLGIHPNLLGSAATTSGMFAQPPTSSPSLNPHHQLFSPSHLAAAALGQSSTQSLSQHIAAALFASNNVKSDNVKDTTSAIPPLLPAPTSAGTSSKPEGPEDKDPEPTIVRQEKVVEALNSKPQRGKRREDLSEKERMELTRTRNREHAKSTRQRKKARYQELLDTEDHLKKVQKAESLQQDRIATVQKFLVVREAMLNDAPSSPSALVELQELVDHLGSFQFEIHCQEFLSTDSTLQHRQAALSRMLQWDQDVRKRCQNFCASTKRVESGGSIFQFKLVDGPDGIAISKNGSGYARVDLLMKQSAAATSETESRVVLSGILILQFVSTSSRLSSASWTTSQYLPSFSIPSIRQDEPRYASGADDAPSGGDEPSSSSNETLENQMIHPSVVSLDLKMSHTDATETNGLGMAI
ncbi:hypothetical protein IV203_037265 [Nitzschia inconspicua]|uniref:BZIP domain-containing protein n=1 Tax=Nitzschia inconspicua TaxID=303405 RepID=A0A9K3PY98_9STRA|nr:hypothetical protein IV203_037265 [Nitzschia inconspicua]